MNPKIVQFTDKLCETYNMFHFPFVTSVQNIFFTSINILVHCIQASCRNTWGPPCQLVLITVWFTPKFVKRF